MKMEFIHIRDSRGLKPEIEDLAKLLSEKEGRKVNITDIVLQALEYGLPLVRQDICNQIVLPRDTMPKSKQLASIAKQMIDIGFAQAFPGESAS